MIGADELAMALDPVLLARRAGIEPDPWQAQVLRSPSKRKLLNCSRQIGKSTTAGIAIAHRIIFQPGSLALLISPSLRQSSELFKSVLSAYRALDRPVPAEAENKLSLELENGSRCVSLPGKESTIRGFAGVDLLVLDEASRIADDLYTSVRPMLATTDGELWALSTPAGRRGWWFKAWIGPEAWERFEVPVYHCPRISPEFIAEERRSNPDFDVEYECKFRETDDQVFSFDVIQRAIRDDIQPLFQDLDFEDGLLIDNLGAQPDADITDARTAEEDGSDWIAIR